MKYELLLRLNVGITGASMRFNWIRSYVFGFCIVAACGVARAQTGSESQSGSGSEGETASEPMSIEDSTTTETTEETTTTTIEEDEGGFWIFPQPAPKTSRIGTDRPGFSHTANLVGRGHVQLEGGYTFTYDREDDQRIYDHRFGELVLRTGLTDWLEFRVGWNGGSVTEIMDRIETRAGRHVTVENHSDGWEDMSLGLEAPILRNKENCPNVSFLYLMGLPTGSNDKSANDVTHFFGLPWNYALHPKFTAYGSINGAVLNSPLGTFWQTSATLAGAYHVHEKVSLYLEYQGKFHNSRDTDCSHILSAGPIIWLSDDLTLDMRAGLGLNEEAPDFQASVGFGLRF